MQICGKQISNLLQKSVSKDVHYNYFFLKIFLLPVSTPILEQIGFCLSTFMITISVASFFFMVKDFKMFTQFIGTTMGTFHGSCCVLILIYVKPYCLNLHQFARDHFCPDNLVNTEINERFTKHFRIAKIIALLNMASLFVTAVLCQPIFGNEYKFFFGHRIFTDYVGGFRIYFLCIYYITILYFGVVVMIAPLFLVIYGALQIKKHHQVLNFHIFEIFNKKYMKDVRIWNNNRDLEDRFVLAIKYHQNIIEFKTRYCKIFGEVAHPVIISGLSMFLLALFHYVYGTQDIISLDPVRLAFTAFTALFALCSGIYYLQQITDEATDFRINLYNFDWYYLDAVNRKSFLMFLTSSTHYDRPLAMLNSYVLGYPAIVKSLQLILSVYTFINNVINK